MLGILPRLPSFGATHFASRRLLLAGREMGRRDRVPDAGRGRPSGKHGAFLPTDIQDSPQSNPGKEPAILCGAGQAHDLGCSVLVQQH